MEESAEDHDQFYVRGSKRETVRRDRVPHKEDIEKERVEKRPHSVQKSWMSPPAIKNMRKKELRRNVSLRNSARGRSEGNKKTFRSKVRERGSASVTNEGRGRRSERQRR